MRFLFKINKLVLAVVTIFKYCDGIYFLPVSEISV